MGVTLEWDNFDEFLDELQHLPETLNEEASASVIEATNKSADELRAAYPAGTRTRKSGETIDHLRNGVKVEIDSSQFGTLGIVRSTAHEAHLWEFGTQVRKTQRGWNRGSAPAHHGQGLVSIAATNRRTMYEQQAQILEDHGFELSGRP
jgi:hypothetical protein